jgi:hypothetical protein
MVSPPDRIVVRVSLETSHIGEVAERMLSRARENGNDRVIVHDPMGGLSRCGTPRPQGRDRGSSALRSLPQ